MKKKKKFIITWEGEYEPPTKEDVFKILLDGNFDDLAKIDVEEKMNYCNECGKEVEVLNELEAEELDSEGNFVCSECINKRMEIQ